jgi:putative Holliday junction resolvase
MSSRPAYTLLGFDFGLARIGVAVGQTVSLTASPLCVVRSQHGKPDWDHIARLVEEWKPKALVLGLPVHMDGTPQPLTKAAKRFGDRLAGRYGLPVFFADERLSSQEASQRVIANKKGQKSAPIDHHAAQIILQNWLESPLPPPLLS